MVKEAGDYELTLTHNTKTDTRSYKNEKIRYLNKFRGKQEGN